MCSSRTTTQKYTKSLQVLTGLLRTQTLTQAQMHKLFLLNVCVLHVTGVWMSSLLRQGKCVCSCVCVSASCLAPGNRIGRNLIILLTLCWILAIILQQCGNVMVKTNKRSCLLRIHYETDFTITSKYLYI